MTPKQVLIIGAGIAGITAAVHAARAGHKVQVFERNLTPGGLSTSWKRKGYYFEGGMHWLVGSTPRLKQHKLWNEVGALQENNPLYYRDPIFTYINGDKRLRMWRKADRLKEEITSFAPEDKRRAKRLCRDIKVCTHFFGVPQSFRERLMQIVMAIPFLCVVSRLFLTSAHKYIGKFRNPDVRAFLSGNLNTEYNSISMIFTLSGYELGDNGFPIGGSVTMARNIADTATSLGAEIFYRRNVDKIVVEDGAVRGAIVDGEMIEADEVIVSSDTHMAIDRFFDEPIRDRWAEKMRKATIPEASIFLCLGIKADLSSWPETLRFKLEEPLKLAGQEIRLLWAYNYSWSKGYAPEGCSTMTVLMIGDTYDWWKAAREDGSYKLKKQMVTDAVVAALSSLVPEIEGNVEVTDLATPLTYERYCQTYRGSWMSVWKAATLPPMVPATCKSVKGLHFCGQRTMLTGGLPVALMTGRRAALSIK